MKMIFQLTQTYEHTRDECRTIDGYREASRQTFQGNEVQQRASATKDNVQQTHTERNSESFNLKVEEGTGVAPHQSQWSVRR